MLKLAARRVVCPAFACLPEVPGEKKALISFQKSDSDLHMAPVDCRRLGMHLCSTTGPIQIYLEDSGAATPHFVPPHSILSPLSKQFIISRYSI